ncbi:MAG TPA: hypothetical protein VG937_33700 [Polyangiaceae bacterium]|jgi:hypothetical protein|nr:hypothetical protein [Polyangiaceae bacterium]
MALWSMARLGAGDGAQEIQSSRHPKLAENCVELIRHRSRRDASQLGNFAMAVAFYEKLHGLPFGAGQTTLQLEIASRKVHEVARWAARVRGNGGAMRSRATHRVCELRDDKRGHARSDGKGDRPLGYEGVGHRSSASSYGLPQLQDGNVLGRVGSQQFSLHSRAAGQVRRALCHGHFHMMSP